MPVSRFKTDEGFTILRVEGKLVATTMDSLKNSLDTAVSDEGHRVVISLAKVEVMDSVAAGLLASKHKTSSKKNGVLAFCGLSPAIKRLIGEFSAEAAIAVYKTEEDALKAIAKNHKNNGIA